MSQLQHALSEAIARFNTSATVTDDDTDNAVNTAPVEASPPSRSPANQPAQLNTEIVFNVVKQHGSITGIEVRNILLDMGYRWATDASSYLNQLANRGLLSRAKEHTPEGFATNRFACLFPEYHRTVKSKKAKAKARASAKALKPTKPTKPAVVAPTPVPKKQPVSPAVAPTVIDNEAQAQDMVAGMSIGLAKAVYLELHHVFNLGA